MEALNLTPRTFLFQGMNIQKMYQSLLIRNVN